jgi:hypothetical protein
MLFILWPIPGIIFFYQFQKLYIKKIFDIILINFIDTIKCLFC